MARLLIKHPELRPYRLHFFDAVARKHQARFIFNRPPCCDRFDHVAVGTTKSSMWRDPRCVRAFFREVALGDYDVLVSSTPTASATIVAVLIARLRRKKVVIWTEEWRDSFGGWKGRFRRFLLAGVYRLTHAHFVTSTKTGKFLRQQFAVEDSAVFFAPQCNRDLAEVELAPISLPTPENAFVFLFLARIIYYKGLDYLIRAFAEVQTVNPEVFLLIVGEGAEMERCRELAQDLKINRCLFYGAIPDMAEGMKAACFAACDVFILPSRVVGNQCEGWGLVVGEAMSMGKPVITTDAVGCADDMIEEGINGQVVRHSSVEELVKAMKIAIEHRDQLPQMGKASREIFERQISYVRMAQKFSDAITLALSVGPKIQH